MQVVLLRVGADLGTSQIHGPLFRDGGFEFVPIPDEYGSKGVAVETFGAVLGRYGRPLIEYFPARLHDRFRDQPMHSDPEFKSFTYGDPTAPKAGLRRLVRGDLLVFYAGLEGWGFYCRPALYIVGYFRVRWAGLATEMVRSLGNREFFRQAGLNFHVRHLEVFNRQRGILVVVKGQHRASRLLNRAVRISSRGRDRNGRSLYVLSPRMREIFGDFGGHVGIQRSPPRWVRPDFVAAAERFVMSLD